MDKILFKLENFNVSYKNLPALKNISIEIREGEKVVLIGPSGGGKTTLLKSLFELNPKQSSFIHQDFALVNQLSVFNNVYSAKLNEFSTFANLKNLIIPNKIAVNNITPILKSIGILDKIHTKVGELSGGQKQRTAIAKSLYHDKKILIADEPVSSVDPHRADELFNKIVSSTKTVIASLHNIDLAKKHANRIIGISQGHIQFDIQTNEITDTLLNNLFNPTH